MSRFVILKHEPPKHVATSGVSAPPGSGDFQTHFDLMLEPALPDSQMKTSPDDRSLLTWRIETIPLKHGMTISRLDDHRRHYLDYEGPVSGNRGFVSRIAAGHVKWLDLDQTHFRLLMDFRFGGAVVIPNIDDHGHHQIELAIQIRDEGSTPVAGVGVNYELRILPEPTSSSESVSL